MLKLMGRLLMLRQLDYLRPIYMDKVMQMNVKQFCALKTHHKSDVDFFLRTNLRRKLIDEAQRPEAMLTMPNDMLK